ncbi:hypothetical protein [Bacillus alkalicellulosilyticus]|uniref:hypothetical protein n=1 Tax=Alkalihalobacterium alkalicellulosilyticum TaxID=1912214 RepID=UPI00099698B1|nr:hypothetical protein [Bacillus alkalicellulosilyticus]
MSYKVKLKQVTIGKKEYEVIHLNQSILGIETWVYPDTQINVYGNDAAINILACLYDVVSTNKVLAYLERHSPEGADLVIFHGQSTPINFRLTHLIRKALKKSRIGRDIVLDLRPECKDDKMTDDWKFEESLSIRVEDHCVLINGSTLGLRLSALECLYLTKSDLGHQHFDWWSTKKSIELIIRNKDRDD